MLFVRHHRIVLHGLRKIRQQRNGNNGKNCHGKDDFQQGKSTIVIRLSLHLRTALPIRFTVRFQAIKLTGITMVDFPCWKWSLAMGKLLPLFSIPLLSLFYAVHEVQIK